MRVISSLIIMLRIGLTTMTHASHVFWLYLTKKLDRTITDRLIHSWCHKLLGFADVNVVVNNPHDIDLTDGHRYLLMGNHNSHYDIPITIIALHGSIRMIAKKELFYVPIFGQSMRAVETISIDRKNKEQAIKDLQVAKQKMDSGIAVWIAPEGTRSRTGELGQFKKGGFNLAIDSNALIVPIAIKGANHVLPVGTCLFNKGKTVTVEVGEPIDARQYDIAHRTQLLDNTRQAIQSLLDK